MNQDKMHLINKIFNNETIRTIWNSEEEKYYISVVDIVGILADSSDPRKYWNWLKNKLIKEENFEPSSITRQLKLKAQDGKYRLTDVVDIEGMFRIIESIPSIDLYRTKGYDEAWISKRIHGIQERKGLTDIWKEGGITEGKEYAILTNEIYKTWSGMTAKEYKEYKGLRKESLRDNMDSLEVSLTDISEEVTKRLSLKTKPKGLKENINVARRGGQVAKNTRDDIEKLLGESIVTNQNRLNYNYIDDKEKIETK